MIKNIVFDIGRVLLNYEPMEHIKKLIENETIHEDIYNSIFRSEEWVNLDRGTITEAEAIEIWKGKAPHIKAEIDEVMLNWYSILTPIEETVKIYKALKAKGYKIYLLSNFHEKAFEVITAANPFFDLADGGVISYKINKVKPDNEIYKYLLAEYDLKAIETVFIDDTEINIKGAEEANIKGILFTSPQKLLEDLEALGCKL